MNTHTNTPKQTARASSIFTAIGVVANVAGVVALLYNQLELVPAVLASIALASGLYLLVRRWGKPLDLVVAFAILTLMAGTATLAIVLDRRDVVPGGRPRPTSTPTASGSPISASHKLLYNDQVTIKAGTGLDVDKRGVAPLTGSAAEAAPSDIRIDLNDFLRSTSGDIFAFYDSSDNSEKCAQLLAAGKDPKSVQFHPYSGSSGYCFLTSDNNIGLIQIKKTSIIGNSPADFVEAVIFVWAK